MSRWWPWWTPSNTPIVTTQRPQPPRRGLEPAPALHGDQPVGRRGVRTGPAVRPAEAAAAPPHRPTAPLTARPFGRLSGAQTTTGVRRRRRPRRSAMSGRRARTPRGARAPTGGQPLAVRQGERLVGVDLAARERRRRPRRRAARRPSVLLVLLERAGDARSNGPTRVRRSALEVPTDAQRGAEVAGQRADVRAGRALDHHVDQDVAPRGTAVEPVHRHRPAAISTCSPARTRAYARLPSTLTADTDDGTCWIAPVSSATPGARSRRR